MLRANSTSRAEKAAGFRFLTIAIQRRLLEIGDERSKEEYVYVYAHISMGITYSIISLDIIVDIEIVFTDLKKTQRDCKKY